MDRDYTELFIIKCFLAIALFFPMYTSFCNSIYYADFILSNVCLGIYILFAVFTGKIKYKKIFIGYFLILIFYNALSLYYNLTYHKWYSNQINVTIIFLFLMILLSEESFLRKYQDEFIRYTIHLILISSIAAIVFFYMGYERLIFRNGQIILMTLPEGYYETRLGWMYGHKSEYGLMLLMFLGFFLKQRDKFRYRFSLTFSCGILFFCLVLCHVWTDLAGGVVILLAFLLDQVNWQRIRFKLYYLILPCILGAGGVFALHKLTAERDMASLGSRTYIWAAAINYIKNKPEGYGTQMNSLMIKISDGFEVNNCHNFFLNEMFRFSILVGVVFGVCFLSFFFYAIIKQRNFLVIGTIIALLLALNMDYCLLTEHMGLFLFVFYLTFLCPTPIMNSERNQRHEKNNQISA